MVIEHDGVQNKYCKETSFILQMSEQSFVILNVKFEFEEIILFTSIGLCNSKKDQVFYTLSENDNLGFKPIYLGSTRTTRVNTSIGSNVSHFCANADPNNCLCERAISARGH